VRWPPSHSLCARYHGFDVELHRSRDAVEIGKVCRAVWRAIEAERGGCA
jgi:hypothetical protein